MVGRLELGRRNVTEHHHVARRSSSAFAKYADASRRISFARRNSTFSRSNCLNRARSSVVSPGRRPASRSARRTQLRSVSAAHPIFFSAIEVIAAQFRCRILGEAVQAATGLVTLHLPKRQRGPFAPFAPKHIHL